MLNQIRSKTIAGLLTMFCLLSAQFDVSAQGLVLAAGVNSNTVVAGSQIICTINITNLTGANLASTYVTNQFSSSATSITASNSVADVFNPGLDPITISSTRVLFRIDNLTNNGAATLTVKCSPLAAGSFTNTVTAFAFVSFFGTNTATTPTNLVTQVYAGQSELSVTITNIASGLYSNDLTAVSLIVSNRGPGSASGVILSNSLPPSFKLLSSTPANLVGAFTNGSLRFNLGTIASGTSTQLVVRLQPTNAGLFALTASVSATNNLDTNSVNNTASNSMSVASFVPATLVATIVSTQRFNPQTGLMEQSILLSNNGTNAVGSARVIVSGLTNWLYNAVGTNGGNPFVLYPTTLAAGSNVQMLLEIFVPTRAAVPDPVLTAVAVDAVNVSAPTNSLPNITLITPLSGGVMIEFVSIPGRTYTIYYADNMSFSNAFVALPSVVAPANKTQWIDSGPPKTVSNPYSVPTRYYRVFQNP